MSCLGDNEKFLEKIKVSKAAAKVRGAKAKKGERFDEGSEFQGDAGLASTRSVKHKRARSFASEKERTRKPAAARLVLDPEDEASSAEGAADEWDRRSWPALGTVLTSPTSLTWPTWSLGQPAEGAGAKKQAVCLAVTGSKV